MKNRVKHSNDGERNTENNVGEKIFNCEECTKVFKSKMGLNGHKLTHKVLNKDNQIASESDVIEFVLHDEAADNKNDNQILTEEEVLAAEVVIVPDEAANKLLMEGVAGRDYIVVEFDQY